MAFSRRFSSAVSFGLALAALACWGGERAGTDATQATVEVLFTPGQDATAAIVAALQHAKSEVLVQAFSFTNNKIARALQRARARGVRVEVVLDQEQFERGAAFVARDLAAARIPVWLDAKHAAAHNKVIIIDALTEDGVVITGSFNFTQAAQNKNAENVVILRDNAAVSRRYRDNCLRHRAHSTQLR